MPVWCARGPPTRRTCHTPPCLLGASSVSARRAPAGLKQSLVPFLQQWRWRGPFPSDRWLPGRFREARAEHARGPGQRRDSGLRTCWSVRVGATRLVFFWTMPPAGIPGRAVSTSVAWRAPCFLWRLLFFYLLLRRKRRPKAHAAVPLLSMRDMHYKFKFTDVVVACWQRRQATN